jgi:hypothetical protein
VTGGASARNVGVEVGVGKSESGLTRNETQSLARLLELQEEATA